MEIKPLLTHIISPESGKIVTPVVCPTRDYQGAVGQSIANIWNVLWVMNREPVYVQSTAHGYSFVRSSVFQQLRNTFKKSVVRGLLIDDDILVPDQQSLLDAISMADKWNWNFISPYRAKDGRITICHASGAMMTRDEVAKLRPWDPVFGGGLGFYYGDIPLEYVFHEGGKHAGEDLNFFADNSWIKPRFIDLGLIHYKVVPLTLTEDIARVVLPGTVDQEGV